MTEMITVKTNFRCGSEYHGISFIFDPQEHNEDDFLRLNKELSDSIYLKLKNDLKIFEEG